VTLISCENNAELEEQRLGSRPTCNLLFCLSESGPSMLKHPDKAEFPIYAEVNKNKRGFLFPKYYLKKLHKILSFAY